MATLTRSVVKGITHRAATVLMTFLMVLTMTQDMRISSLFIVADTAIMTTWYIAHERLWNRVDWGREIIQSGNPPRAVYTIRKGGKVYYFDKPNPTYEDIEKVEEAINK